MQFQLTVEMNNAAFENDQPPGPCSELASILRKAADRLDQGIYDADGTPLFDYNGNRVGGFQFEV